MNKISFLLNYLAYYIKADNKHDIHSPYVFKLVTEVFNDNSPYPVYQKIETLRKQLLKDNTKIAVEDFGAGAKSKSGCYPELHQIKSIAKKSAKPAKYAQLLYRLARFIQPQSLIELGTSLGITACYQAVAATDSKFITCEGSVAIANKAQQNFNQLELKNIEIVTGNFDEIFAQVLNRFETVDWIFFDGNHRKAPTLNYFNEALKKINQNTVFIFDDINWSNEMKEAWNEIKQHSSVTVTIDIYLMGFVFFNKDLSRQHFVIRY
ncbi:MAG: class I SAM-dependent methyltransferase [Bacteroidia bacterium]